MPWIRKRRNRCRPHFLLCLVVAAAGGLVACLLGSLLQSRGTTLANKYQQYKAVVGNYSEKDIQAALEKRGLSGR